jgi:hypothetical protein
MEKEDEELLTREFRRLEGKQKSALEALFPEDARLPKIKSIIADAAWGIYAEIIKALKEKTN